MIGTVRTKSKFIKSYIHTLGVLLLQRYFKVSRLKTKPFKSENQLRLSIKHLTHDSAVFLK